MQCGWNGSGNHRRRYRSQNQSCGPVMLVGAILVATGLLVLFVCIPDWAWLGLLGAALIAVGLLLLKRNPGGR